MAIHRNSKRIRAVYKGSRNIMTVSKDGEIVFSGYDLPKSYGYIEFEVDATDGTYIVPLSGLPAEGTPYHLSIYVNGLHYGDYSGTVDTEAGTGVELTGLSGNTALIRLEPASGLTVGWGRAFGHQAFLPTETGAKGCNTATNKAKLLRVLHDPDYAHLETVTNTGDYFRACQFQHCTALTEPLPEALPDSVTTLGHYFKYNQYGWCSALTATAEESLSHRITTLGDHFRRAQYQYCDGLTVAAAEVLPDSITVIPDGFRSYQYRACNALVSPAEELLPDGITSIGDYFRDSNYSSTGLIEAPAELIPDSVSSIGDYFRYFQYYACKSLTAAGFESLSNKLTTIGEHFRDQQYHNCTSLITAAPEVLPDSVAAIGDYYRYYQYVLCTSLLIGDYVHDHKLPAILNAHANNYHRMFRVTSSKTDTDTVPRYYTDASKTTTAPITDITPTTYKDYLTNRTGIVGYSAINSFWKDR